MSASSRPKTRRRLCSYPAGTSAASAEVAGLATLLAANGKSAAEIATQIKGTTDPVDGSSIGQVNVFNALTATGVVNPEITPTPTVTPVPDVTYVAAKQASLTVSTSSANPSSYGNAVIFSAKVTKTDGTGKGTGTVDFLDGSTTIASSVPLDSSGVAIQYICAKHGSHTITAHYNGDKNFDPARDLLSHNSNKYHIILWSI